MQHFYQFSLIITALINFGMAFKLFRGTSRYRNYPVYRRTRLLTVLWLVTFGIGYFLHAIFQFRYHCFHGIERYMVMKYDFAAALDSAQGIRQAKEAIFTHWAFYPRILEWWNAQCRLDHIYHNSAVFNMMTGAACVLLVYLIARRVWKRQRAAMLAAAIA